MTIQGWEIIAPENFSYAPAEVAQITKAAQAFLKIVSEVGAPKSWHDVTLRVRVLPADIEVDWPQPGWTDAAVKAGEPNYDLSS